MAYVDLNPVPAELAQRIEQIRDTSILGSTATPVTQEAESAFQPDGDVELPDPEPPCDTATEGAENALQHPDSVGRWLARTRALHKRQRAYGSESALRQWIATACDRECQPAV